MAKDKPKNGRRTTDIPGKATRPSTQATPKGTTKKKDPGGFVSPGFKSEGFQAGKRKTKTGPPPSVRARDEKRAKQPPPVKYGGKKKAPKRPALPKWPIDPPKYLRPEQPKKPWPKPKPRKPKQPMLKPKGPRKPKKPMGKGR